MGCHQKLHVQEALCLTDCAGMSENAVVSKAKVPAMRMHTVHAAAEQCAPYAVPARPLARAAAASERGGARRTGMREEQRGKSASIE